MYPPAVPPEFPDRLSVDGRVLPLEVTRKRVRNLNLRLEGERLRASVPLRASRAWVMEHLPRLAASLLQRSAKRDVRSDGRARTVARRVAARFATPPEVAAVEFTTRQTACWGTYSPRTRVIRISAALRHVPEFVLEAVVAHELCHTRYRGHGPRFRALLRSVCPDLDRAEGFLDGATWHARTGKEIPKAERGPLGGGTGGDDGGEDGGEAVTDDGGDDGGEAEPVAPPTAESPGVPRRRPVGNPQVATGQAATAGPVAERAEAVEAQAQSAAAPREWLFPVQ